MLAFPVLRVAIAATVLALFSATVPAQAQTTWTLPTEYPATAIPGEGVTAFAESVNRRTGGALVIKPSYNAEMGIKSAEMIVAVRDGRSQAADAFGGALGGEHPAFGLSSLPFLATSLNEARQLAGLARPWYEKTFASFGLKLLYTTPWPPSGIWSKAPLGDVAALKGLAIRTYDATSTTVLNAAGASAVNLSFADVMPRLKDGSVTAVLSSGDGGAGRRLWEFLPHFTEVNYAVPLSFAFVSAKAYDALPEEQRKAVDAAATETEARQWNAIIGRLEANYATMRTNGVIINSAPPPGLISALKAAALPVVESWTAKAGPDGAAVLAGFRK
jgi:TRAP-type transport system periplasmic protein